MPTLPSSSAAPRDEAYYARLMSEALAITARVLRSPVTTPGPLPLDSDYALSSLHLELFQRSLQQSLHLLGLTPALRAHLSARAQCGEAITLRFQGQCSSALLRSIRQSCAPRGPGLGGGGGGSDGSSSRAPSTFLQRVLGSATEEQQCLWSFSWRWELSAVQGTGRAAGEVHCLQARECGGCHALTYCAVGAVPAPPAHAPPSRPPSALPRAPSHVSLPAPTPRH